MPRQHTASDALFARIEKSIAGGESSYARLAEGPGFCMDRGEGSHIFDVDGNEYIDWCIGYGPLIMGHRHPKIIAAVVEQLQRGGSDYTFPHELDAEVGEKVVRAVPGVDLIRFAMSGTEATLAAMRLARAYTGKDKIAKFEGHYHGWSDEHFVSYAGDNAFAGPEEAPEPTLTLGCPKAIGDTLVIASWNRPEYFEALIARHKDQLAAVLCEPQMCNSGILPVDPEWLRLLRRITSENGILLIFDEVMTGFRLALGGAQGLYGVLPDISCFSKAIGAGFPVAAFGGTREIMQLEASNEVMHGGTYTAMPVNLAASNAVLGEMMEHEATFFPRLHEVGDRVMAGLQRAADEHGVRARVLGLGPLWQIIFLRDDAPDDPVIDNSRTMRAVIDTERFSAFQREMLDRGVYFHPGPFERWFSSIAHSDEDVEHTLAAADEAMAAVAENA
ncbi:MAG TPA: aspartate aminotransferase family protein [Thermoleophilia bacterium]|nr:aspartate aminotransferase family protein [Thermoleophilia bacterium]